MYFIMFVGACMCMCDPACVQVISLWLCVCPAMYACVRVCVRVFVITLVVSSISETLRILNNITRAGSLFMVCAHPSVLACVRA